VSRTHVSALTPQETDQPGTGVSGRLPAEHEDGFRVFADPAGHPFCLVYG
jgi:hypothetical protein